MAHNFQKIYAPFARLTPKDRLVDENTISPKTPWVPYLRSLKFYASEKIDGTSVGIKWDGERISFVGHSDKSQFCPRYLDYLNSRFKTPEFESVVEQIFGEKAVTIYGEGISKDYNVSYGYAEGEFVMYDIQSEESGGFWNRESVKEIAAKLGMIYPEEKTMTLDEAITYVKSRPNSSLDPSVKLEGLVLRPLMEMVIKGERVICKVKVKDFVDCKDYKNA